MLDFPLDAGFFPQLVLTEPEIARYSTLGQQRLQTLQAMLETDAAHLEWSDTPTPYVQSAPVHRVRPTTKRIETFTWLKSTVVLEGVGVEDVLGVVAKMRSPGYRKTMRKLHGNAFVDACVLFNFGDRNVLDEQPQHQDQDQQPTTRLTSNSTRAIKWIALDAGAGTGMAQAGGASILDFVFLEYAGVRRQSSGSGSTAGAVTGGASTSTTSGAGSGQMHGSSSRVVGFCVQESIELARHIPTLEGFGIQRQELSHCGVLISQEEGDNVLRVTSLCRLEARRSEQVPAPAQATMQVQQVMSTMSAAALAPRNALEVTMERWVGAIQGLRTMLSRPNDAVPPPWLETLVFRQQHGCRVCGRRFLLHRKHHCRVCDQVVCSNCAPKRWLAVMSAISMKVRVCWRCMLRTTQEQTMVPPPSSRLPQPLEAILSSQYPVPLPQSMSMRTGGMARMPYEIGSAIPAVESEMVGAVFELARQHENGKEAEVRTLHSRLEQAQQEVRSLRQSLQGREAHIGEMEGTITRLQHGLTISDDESVRHRRLMAALSNENAFLGARYQKQNGRLRGMESEMRGLRSSVRSLRDLVASSTEEVRRLANERAALQRHISDQADEISSLRSGSTSQGG